MATQSQVVTLTELAAAGYITHEVVNYLTKAKLQTAEINAFIRIAKAAGRTLGRGLAKAPGTARMLAMRHPLATAGAVIYVGYKQREEIMDLLSRGYVIATDPSFGQPGPPGPLGETFRPGPIMATVPPAVTRGAKRAVSRANKAVRQGMTWLKAGTKAATGAKPGKHPRGAFKTVVRAAGLANPKTKSRISKGKSIMNKLARRLKKWW